MSNPYMPYPVTVSDIIVENEARDIRTFKVVFENEEDRAKFKHLPGQFAEISIAGAGEFPIGIASSPTEKEYLLFTVKRTGVGTADLHGSEVGRSIGIRGPLGKPFPLEMMEGRETVIVGGGFAFTTLRATIKYILDEENRNRFGGLTVIYGARTPGELVYKDELMEWEQRNDISVHVTVDKADDSWKGREGLVPFVLKEVAPSSANAVALVCGPPIMIKFTLVELTQLGFSPEQIFLSLEMRMKCGIGKCGRCNIGKVYVCKDGPVFSYEELQGLPNEY